MALTLTALPLAGWAQGPMIPDLPPTPPKPPTAATAPTHRTPPRPGVAALVNGQPITIAQVETQAYHLAGADVLNQLIITMLIDQEAKKARATATPAEVNARLAEVRQQFARIPGGLDTVLQQNHQTLATFKDNLRLRLEVEKIVGKTLAPPSLVHARHILVLTTATTPDPNAKPHTELEARALIRKAQDELQAGKSWDEVAKKYSEDPSDKDKGGELGLVSAFGLYTPANPGQVITPLDPTFLQAAMALKAGQITPEPIKSVFGYHLIKVDSTSAAVPASEKAAYAAATKVVRAQQMTQAVPNYIQRLRKNAQVDTFVTP